LPVLASRIEGNTAILGDKHVGLFDPADASTLATLMKAAMSEPTRFLAVEAKVTTSREAAVLLKKVYTGLR
jgi:hypothetical protein